MRSETVKQVALAEAIEELTGILQSLRDTGACRINGQDLTISDTVTLEVEAEADEEHGEIEFEITWAGAGSSKRPNVSILMGSRGDLPVVQKAADVLTELGVVSELRVLSAHQTPRELLNYLADADERGVEVFIAAAGGAAHLAGVVAANVAGPVIGLPIPSANLQGLDSLLSIVQMPKGVPVATVAIGGAENAGLLAAQMLSLKYPALKERLIEYRDQQAQAVLRASGDLVSASTNGHAEHAVNPS